MKRRSFFPLYVAGTFAGILLAVLGPFLAVRSMGPRIPPPHAMPTPPPGAPDMPPPVPDDVVEMIDKGGQLLALITIGSVTLATAISTGLLFLYLRRQARSAQAVMTAIKRGDLQARFPIGKSDEVGALMLRFNEMADEIERGIHERLHHLQDLAHDLRTPLASMRLALETLESHSGGQVSDELRRELVSAALGENLYTAALVEDLLLIARLETPTPVRKSRVAGRAFLEDVVSPYRTDAARPIALKVECGEFELETDAALLKRALRNAIDNAVSFASSSVRVMGRATRGAVEFVIEDDGPGWPAEFLDASGASYGKQRTTRSVHEEVSQSGRIRPSLGLGSVITRKATESLGGSLALESAAPGARLVLSFPR